MCVGSKTVLSVDEESNDLPVENVGDGEGTVIAGKLNKYLDMPKAVGCVIARSYLIQEYLKLNEEDRNAYLAAQDELVLGQIAMRLLQDASSLGFIAYAMLGLSPKDVMDVFGEDVRQEIHRRGYDHEPATTEFSLRVVAALQ